MRVYVYVDGFNVYYRALRGSPYKWLNLKLLAQRLLHEEDEIHAVRYFTARVSARAGDADAPRRQQIYLNALATLQEVKLHFGKFLPKKKFRPLVATGKFVEIMDTEEKGSDVNLATHLLNDAWHGRYDVALVLSQDTDLVEPMRLVTEERNLKLGLVWLDGKRPNPAMAAAASFVRHVSRADLAAAQFSPEIHVDGKQPIRRPDTW